jgi:hypothetical protein
MTLSQIAEKLSLRVAAGAGRQERTVESVYAGDLLSDVIAHGAKDGLWLTIQIHPNIVAVAVLKDMAAVLLANGRVPAPETVQKAEAEGLTVLLSPLSIFELSGRLYEMGLRG